jgi:uncharacterized RDD family membrane protein YckC
LLGYIADGIIATLLFAPLVGLIYNPDDDPASLFAATGSLLLLFVGYLILFDAGPRGATPGKRLVRIRVVDEGGAPRIGYRRAAVRRAIWFLGGLCLYVGWLWVFFDRHRRAWHDKAAGTLVVDRVKK